MPILSGTALGSDAGFRLLAVVPSSSAPEEYWIREVAAVLTDGTVLAIWSDPLNPLAGKTARTDVDLAYDLFLEGIPAGLLNITVTNPDIPDTAGVLAELVRGHARRTVIENNIFDRLTLRGL